ncbi:hypothetical protein ACYATO_08710 [Lactobacillaceae bacterium Melli_B3]
MISENIGLNNKNFTQFLKDNKVHCRRFPSPDNKYKMILSNEVSVHLSNYIKERNSNKRRKQYDYNKRNPKSKELRKLVRSHRYRKFLSIFLKSRHNLTKESLEYSIDSNVYSYYFKMPNHFKIWLKTLDNKAIASFIDK